MKVELKVNVEKETYDLCQQLKAFIAAIQTCTADGWDLSKDLPVVMTSALTNLIPAINNAQQVGANATEDKQAFAQALALGLSDIAFLFVK